MWEKAQIHKVRNDKWEINIDIESIKTKNEKLLHNSMQTYLSVVKNT